MLFLWSGRRDSNPRPSAPKADALPDCATPRRLILIVSRNWFFSSRGAKREPQRLAIEPHNSHTTSTSGMAKDQTQRCRQQQQKNPVPPGMAARLAQVALQQEVVAAVGLPGDVEDIAQAGEWTPPALRCQDWPPCAPASNKATPRIQAASGITSESNPANNIAQARNQPDDPVQSKADAGAGNAECLVEQNLQRGAASDRGRAMRRDSSDPASRWRWIWLPQSVRSLVSVAEWTQSGASAVLLGQVRAHDSMLQSKGYMAAIVQRQNA